MPHALMYHGDFDRNYAALKPGATTIHGSDGTERVLPPWPVEADGARVGYMEKAGKNFYAVRVADGTDDVVLQHEVLIDAARHMGYGKRFAAQPTVIFDDTAHVLLDDIIAKNPAQRDALVAIRDRCIVRR